MSDRDPPRPRPARKPRSPETEAAEGLSRPSHGIGVSIDGHIHTMADLIRQWNWAVEGVNAARIRLEQTRDRLKAALRDLGPVQHDGMMYFIGPDGEIRSEAPDV